MVFHGVFGSAAQTIEEPNLLVRPLLNEPVQHAKHGCYSDSASDEDQPSATRGGIEEKVSRWRFDIKNIAYLDVFVEKG
jgi:hypothetical protein